MRQRICVNMSKIKFSLIESYIVEYELYVLTFIIHEQDLSHRTMQTFVSSNDMKVSSTHYTFLTNNHIYVRSVNRYLDHEKGFSSENISMSFKRRDDMIKYKNKVIASLKEWSQDE